MIKWLSKLNHSEKSLAPIGSNLYEKKKTLLLITFLVREFAHIFLSWDIRDVEIQNYLVEGGMKLVRKQMPAS